MNILVLGGTRFVGRHIVSRLLADGHRVSIFSRGRTNPSLFPDAESLKGDRDSDLSSIEKSIAGRAASGKRFDACVDVSCYTVSQLERSMAVLADHVQRYLFISTISVYKVPVPPDFDEDSPVEESMTDPYVEFSAELYGRFKAECERVLAKKLGARALVYRLGLVSGPWDPTDRATYWMQRSQNGGEVFVPAAPDDPVQLVDARDVAGAVGLGLESGLSGTFNLVNHSTSWQRWLDTSAKSATQTGKSRHRSPSPTEFIWADDQEWVGSRIERIPEPRSADPLPMFLPVRYGWNFWRASNARALDAGVRFRPYEQTIRDTLEWRGEWTAELNAGLTGAQEKHLITAWRTRDQSG